LFSLRGGGILLPRTIPSAAQKNQSIKPRLLVAMELDLFLHGSSTATASISCFDYGSRLLANSSSSKRLFAERKSY